MIIQSTTERTEYLRDRWKAEFAGSALMVLVDQAMSECSLTDAHLHPPELDCPADRLRLALGATYETVQIDTRIEWAHRLDKEVMTFEEFVERETGE